MMSRSACRVGGLHTRRSTSLDGNDLVLHQFRPARVDEAEETMDFTFTGGTRDDRPRSHVNFFEHRVTPERSDRVLRSRRGAVRRRALWHELATVDLLGIALPENVRR